MTYVQAPGYREQRFLSLEGLDGLSPPQIAEHLAPYHAGLRGHGARPVHRRLLPKRCLACDRATAARAARRAPGRGGVKSKSAGR